MALLRRIHRCGGSSEPLSAEQLEGVLAEAPQATFTLQKMSRPSGTPVVSATPEAEAGEVLEALTGVRGQCGQHSKTQS